MARVRREGITRKMSESNKVQKLKKSKKYAYGKEYNTLEGRIKIVNRYLENGEIMISYLNMETEEIVIKAELDVNAMLYAYTRELAQKVHENAEIAVSDEIEVPEVNYPPRAIESLTAEIQSLKKEVGALKDNISTLKDDKKTMQDIIEEKQAIIEKQFELIGTLIGTQTRG